MTDSRQFEVVLQPKQYQLMELLMRQGHDAPTWIGYGGARGGAKSGGLRRCAVALMAQEPGINIWIFRRVYEDLRKDHIEPMFDDFPALRELYRVGDKEIVLPHSMGDVSKSSKIGFVYAETHEDVIRKFRGPEAKYIFVDQAEQLTEDELRRIKAANRAPGTGPGACKTGLFFNPGGVGTEFLRRIFYLRQYTGTERAEDFAFIQSYGWDNYEWFRGLGLSVDDFYALPGDRRFELFITQTNYGRNLNELPPALRVGELLGSFEHFAGQYFAGAWDENTCVVNSDVARQMIEPWWIRWIAEDWGFSDHAATVWFAAGKLSPGDARRFLQIETNWTIDVIVVYREYIAVETPEGDVAHEIIKRTPKDERLERFWISPDAVARKSAHTVAEEMGKIMDQAGFPMPESADNDRIGGWRLMYNGLRQSSSLRGSTASEERAKQGPLLLVSADCPNVISCIPLAMRDPDDVEDVQRAHTLWEDVTDGVRYGFKSYLGASGEIPLAVQRQKVFDSHSNMTARAMALKKFDFEHNSRRTISRYPRWRA